MIGARNEELRRLQQAPPVRIPLLLWLLVGAGLAFALISLAATIMFGTGSRVADRSSVDRNYNATRCAINLTLIPDDKRAALSPAQLAAVCPDVVLTERRIP